MQLSVYLPPLESTIVPFVVHTVFIPAPEPMMDTEIEAGASLRLTHSVSAMAVAVLPVVPVADLFEHLTLHPKKPVPLEGLLEADGCGRQLVSQLMVTDCVPRVSCTTVRPKESLYIFVRVGQVKVCELTEGLL